MPTLHVRSVPEDLYLQLQSIAQAEQRSLSAEVIALLTQALAMRKTRLQQLRVLTELRRRRFVPSADMPNSSELLWADRNR